MLYIIKRDYFLTDYILDALRGRDDIKIIRFERLRPHGVKRLPHQAMRFVRAFVCNHKGLWTDRFFSSDFLEALKSIKADDTVLFWGCENLKELLTLNREIAATKKNVFLWNPVSTICRNAYSQWEYRHYLHHSGMQVYSFDDADARRYSFNAINQVYRMPKALIGDDGKKFDVFYVGVDKHRTAALERLKAEFDAEGITYSINILKDKHTEPSKALMPCYVDRLIPYGETLKMIAGSRCILEILQKGQGGMTLRSMEALFMGKKLITNNHAITTTPIYNPANIYVLGADERSLTAFLDTPAEPIASSIVNSYEITHWIKKFL